MSIYNIISYVFIITLIFCIWIEYTVGNVLIRQNSSGNYIFTIYGMLDFLTHPLRNLILWNPTYWDINYILILIISISGYFIYEYVKNVNIKVNDNI